MSQKLRKIMTEKVVTIEPNATVKKAAELMNIHEIGCLIVVSCEKPVGILTERDLSKRIVCKSRDPEKTSVVEVMSKPLITASPNMRAGDAAKLMLERNIKKAPSSRKWATNRLSFSNRPAPLRRSNRISQQTHPKRRFKTHQKSSKPIF